MIVLTGALTDAITVDPRARITAEFTHLGQLSASSH